MKTITIVFLMITATSLSAQTEVNGLVVFGGGMTSSIAGGAKSLFATAGTASIIRPNKNSGLFFRPFVLFSRIAPQRGNTRPFWSFNPGSLVGYRIHSPQGRLSLVTGLSFPQNRLRKMPTTVLWGFVIRTNWRRATLLTVGSRTLLGNTQAWGVSTTYAVRIF